MKLNFCIIDDEPYGSLGWDRAIGFLRDKSYIEEIDEIDALDGKVDCAMDFSIFSSENGFKLSEVREYLKRESENFDFFIIDLKLNFEGFNDVDDFVDDDNFEELPDGKKPSILAGLDFLNILPKNEKPKLFYSGHSNTHKILSYINLVENRFEDIKMGNINLDTYQSEMESSIDKYLHKNQTEIISFLSMEFRKILKKRLKIDDFSHWKNADIPDFRKKHPVNKEEKFWSLRTLFPKQFNLAQIEGEKNKAIEYIENILKVDWRTLLSCRFSEGRGLLCHPGPMEDNTRELAKQMARELEFKVQGKVRSIYNQLTGLSEFHGDCELLRDGIIKGSNPEYLIKYDNGNVNNTGWMSVMDYFSLIDSNNRGWYDILYKWASNFGIYLIDIAYISHIAFHNRKHTLNNTAPEFCYNSDKNGQLYLTWNYKLPKENLSEIFSTSSKLFSKFEDAANNKYVLWDEGVSDIVKIVLWRYYGVVEFRAGRYLIGAKRDNDKEMDIFREDALPKIDFTELKITISAPD